MTTMKQKRGTAAQWATANPVLADGEIGLERDTKKFKFGDGVTAWAQLPYVVSSSDFFVNALDYGFLPTASATANNAAMVKFRQACLDKKKPGYLGEGDFHVSAPLPFKDSTSLTVFGAGITTRIFNDNDASDLMHIGGYRTHMHDFELQHTNEAVSPSFGLGIVFFKSAYSTFKRLQINNTKQAIVIAQENVFEPGTSSGASNWMFSNTFEDININRYAWHGLVLHAFGGRCTGSTWNNIYIQNKRSDGTIIDSYEAVTIFQMDESVFTQLNVEDHKGNVILINSSGHVVFSSLHIERNYANNENSFIVRSYGNSGLIIDSLSLAFCDVGGTGSTGSTSIANVEAGGKINIRGISLNHVTNTNNLVFAIAHAHDNNSGNSIEVTYVINLESSPYVDTNTPGAGIKRIGDNLYGLKAGSSESGGLATVATTGSYTDLTNRPLLPVKTDLLFGWQGYNIPDVTRDLMGTWMSRNNWYILHQADYLYNNSDLNDFRPSHYERACDLGVPLIPHDDGSDLNYLLGECINGNHDSDYTSMGGNLSNVGTKTVYARIYWEFNLRNGYNGPGDVIDRAKFISAWNRAVPLIRAGFNARATEAGRTGQTIKFVFCPLSDGADYKPFYPGDTNVDLVSMDIYASMYRAETPTPEILLADVKKYLKDITDFGALHSKPVSIGEWGNWQTGTPGNTDSKGLGDFVPYIDLMFQWAIDHNFVYICYYNLYDNTGITLNEQPKSLARVQEWAKALRPKSVLDEGVALPKRTTINFVGAGVTATDDAALDTTTVNIPGAVSSGGGSAATITSAINIIDASRTGIMTGQMIASNGGLSENDYTVLKNGYANIGPNLVSIFLTANDYLNNGSTPSIAAELLRRLIDDLRALPDAPSILLIIPHNLNGHESNGRGWADYRTMLQGLATEKSTGLFDMATVIPTSGSGSPLLAADGLHYSSSGHAAIATALQTFLADLMTSKPAWAKSWVTACCGGVANYIAIGDSLTEGQGAPTKAERWLDRLLVGLRTTFGLPAPTKTYTPAFYAVYDVSSSWGNPYSSTQGNNTGTNYNQPYVPGLGVRTLQLGRGSTVTYTGVGSSVEIVAQSAFALTYQVDGGEIKTLPGSYTTGTGSGAQRVLIPLGYNKSHTVKIINVDVDYAEYCYVGGLTWRKDPAS